VGWYTLADLVRVTGAKRRSLQLWADAAVILADRSTDRAGTGTHRRFSRDEAIIACVIHAFALHQIAIGELFHIAIAVRFSIRSDYPEREIRDRAARDRDILEMSIRGEGNAVLVFESWRDRERKPSANPSSRLSRLNRLRGYPDPGSPTAVKIFRSQESMQLNHVHKQQGFAAVILLRNYLSKIDS
jgi:hypothetical protein